MTIQYDILFCGGYTRQFGDEHTVRILGRDDTGKLIDMTDQYMEPDGRKRQITMLPPSVSHIVVVRKSGVGYLNAALTNLANPLIGRDTLQGSISKSLGATRDPQAILILETNSLPKPHSQKTHAGVIDEGFEAEQTQPYVPDKETQDAINQAREQVLFESRLEPYTTNFNRRRPRCNFATRGEQIAGGRDVTKDAGGVYKLGEDAAVAIVFDGSGETGGSASKNALIWLTQRLKALEVQYENDPRGLLDHAIGEMNSKFNRRKEISLGIQYCNRNGQSFVYVDGECRAGIINMKRGSSLIPQNEIVHIQLQPEERAFLVTGGVGAHLTKTQKNGDEVIQNDFIQACLDSDFPASAIMRAVQNVKNIRGEVLRPREMTVNIFNAPTQSITTSQS